MDKNTSIYFLRKVQAKLNHPMIMNKPPMGVTSAMMDGKSIDWYFKKESK